MKILVIEAYTAANIGSGALVENSVKLLHNIFPYSQIEILAQSPESISRLVGLPTYHELLKLPLRKPRLQQALWFARTLTWMMAQTVASGLRKVGLDVPEALYTINEDTLLALHKIKESDIIVSIGAERINDNFYKSILFSLFMLLVTKQYGKFLVLFPQTIGPFHFRITRILSKWVLNRCDVIFLRDRKSNDILQEIGVTGPRIIDTCDVAVMQPAIPANEVRTLLKSEIGEFADKPLVGMSVMKWSYIKAEGRSGYEEYKDAIARVADEIIEKRGAKVVFLATNVLVEGCREDDVSAAREIVQLMKNKEGAFILDRLYSPAEMKGIMSMLDLCIVTRMHACIFSTGIHTPTVSINYQFKLHEYMKLVGLGDYTIDIDTVTYESLRELVERAFANLPAMRSTLAGRIGSMKEQLTAVTAQLPAFYRR